MRLTFYTLRFANDFTFAGLHDRKPLRLPRSAAPKLLLSLVLAFWGVASHTALAAVGRTPGIADVSATGTGTYTIPLWTPAGAARMQPQLSLVYRHTSGNGRLGVGWSIAGLGVITRCNKTIAQDGFRAAATLAVDDAYCLNGDRLRLVSGTYGTNGSVYQTEIESYARVTASGTAGNGPAWWMVETKDGLIYEYGNTADSRIESVGSSTARAWALSSMRDRAGNTISYEYFEDTFDGSFRPERITYATNTAAGLTSAPYQVDFVYETADRPDPIYGYWGGDDSVDGRIWQFKRLDTIEIGHDGDLNGSYDTVKIYDIAYDASGGAGNRSRIASITECAATTADCLAPTNLTWTDATAGVQAENDSLQTIPALTEPLHADVNGDGLDDVVYVSSATAGSGTWRWRIANGAGYNAEINTAVANTNFSQARIIEWDGDGLADLLVPSAGNEWHVYRSTGTGYAAAYDTNIASNVANSHYAAYDIDGDGRDDLVRLEDDPAWGLKIYVRLREVNNFSAETLHWSQWDDPADGTDLAFRVYNTIAAVPGPGYRNRSLHRRLDYDGDGREDFLIARRSSTYRPEFGNTLYVDSWSVVFGSGGSTLAFSKSSTSNPPAYAPLAGDFNGDGITDLAWTDGASGSNWEIQFSRGKALTNVTVGPPSSFLDGSNTFVMDYDRDGKDDLMGRYLPDNSWKWYRSTGNTLANGQSTGIVAVASGRVATLNHDPFADLAYVNLNDSKLRYRFSYTTFADLLDTISDGFDVAADFDYALLTDSSVYTKGSGAVYPQVDVRPSMIVVKQLTLTDGGGEGATYALDFTYQGARLDLEGRGFLGFEQRNVTDTSAGYNQRLEEYYEQAFPYIGALDKVYLKQSSGTMIRDTNYTWSALSWGTGSTARSFPYASTVTTRHHELGGSYNGTHFRTETYTVTAVDSTSGTVTDSQTVTTELATGLYPQSSKTERVWHSSILNDTTNWCLGRPQRTERTNSHTLPSGTAITRTTDLAWSGVDCRPTQQTIEPGDVSWEVVIILGYDVFGNLDSRAVIGKNMPARTTTIDWGTRGQVPETVTNPLNQATTQGWRFDLGLPTSISDPNGLQTSWSYDNFGRRLTETRPDLTSTAWTIGQCSAGCDSRERYFIETRHRNTSNTIIRTDKSAFDQHDQLLFSFRQLPGGANSVVADVVRDARGRIQKIHVPYWAGGAGNGYRQLVYDGLDRVSADQLYTAGQVFDRSSQYDYEGLVTRSTDPLSNVTVQTISGWGDIVGVADAGNGNTTYEYSAFGQLKRVIDTNTIPVASIDYNITGVRTGLNDGDLGGWSFTPNALGEIVSQTDAKQQTTTFVYDKVGRLTQRTESEGTSTWTWGTSALNNEIGRLTSVSGPGGYSESYDYDATGRLSQRTINSDASYVYDFAYNDIGALDTLTYPTSYPSTRVKLKYGYSFGYNNSIRDYTGDVLGTTYWALNTVDQRGNPIDTNLGSLNVITGFDALTGLVDYVQSGTGGTTTNVQNLDYDWDDGGNFTKRSDQRQGLVEEFTYDTMNRLDLAKVNTVPVLDLTCTANGNIDTKSDVGSSDYGYHTSKVHAVETAGSHSFSYDANGNAIARNGAGVTWTSYNKPSQINGNGQVSAFWYAPDRSRWKQEATYCSGDETTIYAGGLLEKQTVGTATTYKHLIHAPDGNRIQQVLRDDGSSDTFYIATDHLGSSDVILKNSAVHVYTSFDAFGQRRDPTDWTSPISSGDWPKIKSATRRGFTGHEHLDNVGLIHMNGRVQDPVVGRFLSADPFVQAPYFSESLNRYSYTFNRPLSYTDPSGFRTRPKTYRVEPGNRDAIANILRFVCGVCVSTIELMSGGGTGSGYPGLMNGLPGSLRFGAGDAGAMGREFSGGAGGGGAALNRPYTAVGQPDVQDFTISRTDEQINDLVLPPPVLAGRPQRLPERRRSGQLTDSMNGFFSPKIGSAFMLGFIGFSGSVGTLVNAETGEACLVTQVCAKLGWGLFLGVTGEVEVGEANAAAFNNGTTNTTGVFAEGATGLGAFSSVDAGPTSTSVTAGGAYGAGAAKGLQMCTTMTSYCSGD